MRHAPEEGDEEPDLRAAVQPRIAREGPRDAAQVQRAQERVRIVIGADEDGAVAVGPTAGMLFGDQLGDLVGFARDRIESQMSRRHADPGPAVGPRGFQLLVDPLRHLEPIRIVELDEPVRGIEHRLGRPAIFEQHHLLRVRIRPVEVEDIAHRSAAEAEDRLIVVAHHGDVPVLRGEQLDHLELGVVRVLELVHEDEAIALLAALEHVRARAKETEDLHDLVAEVDLAQSRHERLVLGVRACELHVLVGLEARGIVFGGGEQLLGMGEILVRAHILVLEPAEERDHGVDVARGVAQRAEVPERELEEMVTHEDDLLGPREHTEVGGEAELEGVLFDQPVAEGVKRRDLHVRVAVRHELVHPLFHLGGRFVREGQGEDLRRARLPRGDQIGDAACDDGGLAGAGAGDDQERAGRMRDCLALGLGQAFENPGGAAGGLRHQNLNAK